jgi:hypothetical protein
LAEIKALIHRKEPKHESHFAHHALGALT